MKRRRLLLALVGATFGITLAVAQTTPAPAALYTSVTLKRVLEVISGARREMWLIAPTLREANVYRALRSRVDSGVVLRLLIANREGYTGFEVNLARSPNVDARWLKERFGAAVLVVDDRAAVISPLLGRITGGSGAAQSIEVSRPEVVAATGAAIKQVFAQARRVR